VVDFVGRSREISYLERELDAVRQAADHPGRCLLLRGRRRVGKSRLVEAFCQRASVPSVFYAAAGVPMAQELSEFAAEVRNSDLPGRDVFDGVTLDTWAAGLRLLADALPASEPSIVVLDELPYLVAADPGFEGTLQQVWDRVLSRKPVLLPLIGSHLSMMEALDTYGRPFHQRGKPMVLDPLSPAEVAAMTRLDPAAAFDAYLITGGLPLICAEWRPGMSRTSFLRESLSDSTSALTVSAELAMAAEFPVAAQARAVLSAIGAGERTFTLIQRVAGGLPPASLTRSLDLLISKRVVVAERPVSTRPSKDTRYRIADPYLRFWLSFLGPHLGEVDRGRGDRVLARIDAGWASWRGRAIEPVVREALSRLLPDNRLSRVEPADVAVIGGYWTRTNDVEVDLVAGDRGPVAQRIGFVGSIKWHERTAFDSHDLARLHVHRARVPGADDATPLVAVGRVRSELGGLDASYGAEDLLRAWPN
jgi:AAA+ ATPase superfamily predicted ATPase